MKRLIGLILMTALISVATIAAGQQVVSSAGASATGTNVQLSWNLGEPVIETFTGSSVILTQGLLQTKLVVTDISPLVLQEMTLLVYPNPVSSSLRLDVRGDVPANLSFSLLDLNGKQLLNRQVESLPELIDMAIYPRGVYLMNVTSAGEKSLKIFRIIKN